MGPTGSGVHAHHALINPALSIRIGLNDPQDPVPTGAGRPGGWRDALHGHPPSVSQTQAGLMDWEHPPHRHRVLRRPPADARSRSDLPGRAARARPGERVRGRRLFPDSISGNEAARLVPRRECSTTRPASTESRARHPSHAGYPPSPTAARGRTQGRRASVPAVSVSRPMPSAQPARRHTECAYAPDYRPDHGRSAHDNTSPGAVCRASGARTGSSAAGHRLPRIPCRTVCRRGRPPSATDLTETGGAAGTAERSESIPGIRPRPAPARGPAS